MSESSHTSKLEYMLRLGDTALVLSQRLGALCGKGPALEEDLAMANTALDLLGQARNWLTYAGEIEGRGRDEDALAYFRGEREFRNLLLVEQPNGDYAQTLVRQFFFDAWHALALARLAESSDARIGGIAAKAQKEVAYHLRRSTDLVVRLGDGTAESRRRMQAAVDLLWPFTGEMFERDAVEDALAGDGVAFIAEDLREAWMQYVGGVLREATLTMPPPESWMQRGGRRGVHTEHLGYLLAEMQSLPRSYPEAKW